MDDTSAVREEMDGSSTDIRHIDPLPHRLSMLRPAVPLVVTAAASDSQSRPPTDDGGGSSTLVTPVIASPAVVSSATMPSALKGSGSQRTNIRHRRQASFAEPLPSAGGTPVRPPLSATQRQPQSATLRRAASGGKVSDFITTPALPLVSTRAPIPRTHSGQFLPTPPTGSPVLREADSTAGVAIIQHLRRSSSHLSSVDGEVRATAIATYRSAAFPASDFHRPTHAGSITVLSEVVGHSNRRVFQPREVTIAVGDTVLFRWYGHHKVAQLDADGVPLPSGYGANRLPRRNGELVVTFDTPGVFHFGSVNHHRCLRAVVFVTENRLVILDTIRKYVFQVLLAAAVVLACTAAGSWLIRGWHLLGSEGFWSTMDSITMANVAPWVIAAASGLVVAVVVGVVRGCRRPRLNEYGRGYSERVQAITQIAVVFSALLLTALIYIQWAVVLRSNEAFERAFIFLLSGVSNVVNQAIATLADVRFLMGIAPRISSDAVIPASAMTIMGQVEAVISTVYSFTYISRTSVDAVFRGLALLHFLSLQSHLFVVALGLVAASTRRSGALRLSIGVTVTSLLLSLLSCGVTSLIVSMLNTAHTLDIDVSRNSLTSDELRNTLGVAPSSSVAHFAAACSGDGLLSVDYVNQQVQYLVQHFNEQSPPELFIHAQLGNFTNIAVLVKYTDFIVAQLHTVQTVIARNGTFAAAIRQQMSSDLGVVIIPGLQAALRVAETAISLVNCRILREIAGPLASQIDDVITDIQILHLVQLIEVGMLLTHIVVLLVAAHVFDRPYKFWYEPKTGRWFRFRACYLAHRRLLMRARFAYNCASHHRQDDEHATSESDRTAALDEVRGPAPPIPPSSRRQIGSVALVTGPQPAGGPSPCLRGSPMSSSVSPTQPTSWASKRWLLSAMHQASLLSGAMLMMQAGLLLTLHVSYADNRLSTLLEVATSLCVVYPVLAWPADGLKQPRTRVGLRVAAALLAIAIFVLLVVSASFDLSRARSCIQHIPRNGTLQYMAAGECGIRPTLQRLQSGVSAALVGISSLVALVSSVVMAFFPLYRVGLPIADLFAERGMAISARPQSRAALRGGVAVDANSGIPQASHSSSSESEEEMQDLHPHRRSHKKAVLRRIKRRLFSSPYQRKLLFRRVRALIVTSVVAVALVFAGGLLFGHWFAKPDTTVTVVSDNPYGCNGDARFCSTRIDEVVWFTTHNSMSALDQDFIGPNHFFGVPRQLQEHVRAFMIDAHPFPQYENQSEAFKAWLCHEDCRLGGYLLIRDLELLKKSMALYPNDIYILLFEQYSNDSAVVAAFEEAGLVEAIWAPSGAPDTDSAWVWPTFDELIKAGKRILVFTDNNNSMPTADMGSQRPSWFIYMWDYIYETPFTVLRVTDFDCRLHRGVEVNATDNSTLPVTWKKMSTLNHFLTAPVAAPFLARVANQPESVESHFWRCMGEWQGRVPNFVAVDFWTVANPALTVQKLNYEIIAPAKRGT